MRSAAGDEPAAASDGVHAGRLNTPECTPLSPEEQLRRTLRRLDDVRDLVLDALIEATETPDLLRLCRVLADIGIARQEVEEEIAACERLRPYLGDIAPARRRA